VYKNEPPPAHQRSELMEQFMSRQYRVELVWNREFDFVPRGDPYDNIDAAIQYAKAVENMGDGERVKKTRVVDDFGSVVWAGGKKIQ
jgi:hypothetical protein